MAAAGPWTLTNQAKSDMLGAVVNIGTDTYKMALVASTGNVSATSTTYAAMTGELATANGYTSGGQAVTLSKSGTSTVTVAQSAAVVWTASGGSITARWAVIYEVAGDILCYALLDSTPADVTATTGNTLTVGGTAATVFTLA